MRMKLLKRYFSALLFLCLILPAFALPAFAAATGTHYPLEVDANDNGGIEVSVKSAKDNTMSNGAITVTSEGSDAFLWWSGTIATTYITITNVSAKTATIGFNWVATSVNKLEIDSIAVAGNSNSYSKLLEPTGSIELVITTGENSTTNKLVLSGFTLTVAEESSSISFEYDNTLGSITVGGSTVTSGTTQDIDVASGAALKALPNSGTKFLGWVDKTTGEILSRNAEHTYIPAKSTTVQAVFVTAASNAWFRVGTLMFNDLNIAVTKGEVVIPEYDGVLPAGNYTIPAGVTLLIPYDAAGTVVTTSPVAADTGGTHYSPTAFRTLTMAQGAHITIDGSMSVAGSLHAHQTQGHNGLPMKETGQVKMNTGSSITVNANGNLYVIGYIYGSGSVEVLSQGNVYECFQIRDFRGGTATTSMKSAAATRELFPLMQYYVQNIQVPLKLNAGALETGITAFTTGGLGIYWQVIADLPFMGSDGMFKLESGYIVKDYIESSDRLKIEIVGTASVSNYKLTLESVSIDTKEFILPINHNMTVEVKSGSNVTISQDLSVLPSAELILCEGADATLASGNKVIVYDKDQWGKYCGEANLEIKPLMYMAGGTIFSRTAAGLTDGKVQIDGDMDVTGAAIYTTASGANICSTGTGKLIGVTPGTVTTAYQATQSGSSISYVDISVTPAKLKNGNETYVETSTATGTTTYEYIDGFWRHEDVATWYNAEGEEVAGYLTLGRAINAYTDGDGYIQIVDNAREINETVAVTADKTIPINVNGNAITLNQANDSAGKITIYGLDTSGDAFGVPDGSITGNVPIAPVTSHKLASNTKHYAAYMENGATKFYRVGISLTGIQFVMQQSSTDKAYLSFEATVRGNSIVFDNNKIGVADMGFTLNPDAQSPETSWVNATGGKNWTAANDGKVYFTKEIASKSAVQKACTVLDFKNESAPIIASDPKTITSILEVMTAADLGLSDEAFGVIRTFLNQ